MEDTKNNRMAESVIAATTLVYTSLSLPGKPVFFYDLSESERFTMSSRGEDEVRAFSFAKPLFYWILLSFSVDGWEVSAV